MYCWIRSHDGDLIPSVTRIDQPFELLTTVLLTCMPVNLQKRMKVKELCKKSKSWKKKSWPQTYEDVELLFGVIDIKVLSRVLRMVRISKEQLIWCEEKLKKLHVSDGKLLRDPSPILFPC